MVCSLGNCCSLSKDPVVVGDQPLVLRLLWEMLCTEVGSEWFPGSCAGCDTEKDAAHISFIFQWEFLEADAAVLRPAPLAPLVWQCRPLPVILPAF